MTATSGLGAELRVLIIGMYYSPAVTGNAPYTAGLAGRLAARGDEVTVLTGLPHLLTMPDAGAGIVARC